MRIRKMSPWLLVVVDGPSEVRDAEDPDVARGVVTKILAQSFGDEWVRNLSVRYWRHLRESPLRKEAPLRKGRGDLRLHGRHADKAARLAALGSETTAFGTVILLDNDHDQRSDRWEALRAGVEASGAEARTAFGLAREMVEAWLLADQKLLVRPLPKGKRCEDLWGQKDDPTSNYPKHVLRRCVLEPRGWTFPQAVEAWDQGRARSNSASLDDFLSQVERLADAQYVR
jgi:hypothetical protein